MTSGDEDSSQDRERGSLSGGAEHLQAAVREMIQAARAVLDVVEDLVDDPDRVRDVVDNASGVVGDVISLSQRRPKPNNPWFDEAYTSGSDGDDEPKSDTGTPKPGNRGGFERIDLG